MKEFVTASHDVQHESSLAYALSLELLFLCLCGPKRRPLSRMKGSMGGSVVSTQVKGVKGSSGPF